MGVVVSVLGVHWLLFQSLAHVAGILSAEAGNGDWEAEEEEEEEEEDGIRPGLDPIVVFSVRFPVRPNAVCRP